MYKVKNYIFSVKALPSSIQPYQNTFSLKLSYIHVVMNDVKSEAYGT